MVKHGVNAYFLGHDHQLAYMYEPGTHLRYVRSGTGQASKYFKRDSFWRTYGSWAIGFIMMEVTPCVATLTAHDGVNKKVLSEDGGVMELPNYRANYLVARGLPHACTQPPLGSNDTAIDVQSKPGPFTLVEGVVEVLGAAPDGSSDMESLMMAAARNSKPPQASACPSSLPLRNVNGTIQFPWRNVLTSKRHASRFADADV